MKKIKGLFLYSKEYIFVHKLFSTNTQILKYFHILLLFFTILLYFIIEFYILLHFIIVFYSIFCFFFHDIEVFIVPLISDDFVFYFRLKFNIAKYCKYCKIYYILIMLFVKALLIMILDWKIISLADNLPSSNRETRDMYIYIYSLSHLSFFLKYNIINNILFLDGVK